MARGGLWAKASCVGAIHTWGGGSEPLRNFDLLRNDKIVNRAVRVVFLSEMIQTTPPEPRTTQRELTFAAWPFGKHRRVSAASHQPACVCRESSLGCCREELYSCNPALSTTKNARLFAPASAAKSCTQLVASREIAERKHDAMRGRGQWRVGGRRLDSLPQATRRTGGLERWGARGRDAELEHEKAQHGAASPVPV